MRLLVSCPRCKRQYNARGLEPGKRFRCHCGADVVVRRPRGHSASVIRCASCGAPRGGRALACEHCGADFTLRDQDLHTVCPNCLARVSDQARFCHHCASPLFAEMAAGQQTDYHCPVCGDQRALVSRRLTDQQVTVMECGVCGGLWLGLETFRAMLDQAEIERRAAPRIIPPPRGAQLGPRYRCCVICGGMMIRRNLGRGGSGVIVDLCGSHGIWFDADELSQLMAWIRSGGLEEIRAELARLRNSDDAVRRRHAIRREAPKEAPVFTPRNSPVDGFDPPLNDHYLIDLAAAAVQLLARVFFKI